MLIKKESKILVAMSGGVDSSVSAWLLAKDGYSVAGVHMSLPVFSSTSGRFEIPTESQGFLDAKKICHMLGIPFFSFDFGQEFQARIIDYFCMEYLSGRTPNPCILCNQSIKFGLLLEKSIELGFDFLATGHYVSLVKDDQSNRFFLQRAKDSHKDQSYFLYALNQEQLKRVIFPLGNYTKEEVRAIAKDLDLPIYNKAESQEICFLPCGDYTEILKTRAKGRIQENGPILNSQGKVLGYHKGIYSYTIGQRRGLGLYHPTPLYVLAINPEQNAIVVGEESETYHDQLIASRINWMLIDSLQTPMTVLAQIRYRHKPRPAIVSPFGEDQESVMVHFKEPVKSIATGQSVVFYLDNRLMGGGIIDKIPHRFPLTPLKS